jgi:hypothetical protein
MAIAEIEVLKQCAGGSSRENVGAEARILRIDRPQEKNRR